jgi:tRNA U34 2-thiouridine synthase MnmA/TrmU
MKVLVAMNGGLKSLVTAWLLKKQGMQIRGVYFDWTGHEKVPTKIEALERKFGISIQVVPAFPEYQEKLGEAQAEALRFSQIFDQKIFFHQNFLFPKLIKLKEQHGFEKIATGHRVLIHEDQVAEIFRVYQNADHDLRDVAYLIGRNQKELASLLLPLGSIPTSMFEKLAKELDMGDASQTAESRMMEAPQPLSEDALPYEVQTVSGSPVGTYPIGKIPKPGDIYRKDDQPEIRYLVIDIHSARKQVWVEAENELKIEEIHFYDTAWFGRTDLKLNALHCGLTSPTHPKTLPIRLLQYEGGRVKGFLNQPLLAEDANIFKGQTMLWVEGQEIMGGGRVLQTR